jgi:hypothetical protein
MKEGKFQKSATKDLKSIILKEFCQKIRRVFFEMAEK